MKCVIATVEPGEPGLTPRNASTPDTKSAWWTWTAPANQRIAGSVGCNNFNVYRVDGPGFGGLTPISTGSGSVTLDAIGGTQYAFQCTAPYGHFIGVVMQWSVLANHATASSDGAVPGTMTITSPRGSYVVNVGVSSLSSSALPDGVVDLSGALSYGISNVTPGSTVQVRIDLPTGSAPTGAYKLSGGSYVDQTNLASIDGDSVTLNLTDGGPGDADGVANGTITDPVVLTRGSPSGAQACTTICVSVADHSMYEGDAGTHTLNFPVTLSQPATSTVTVHYAVTGNTTPGFTAIGGNKALAGVDFKLKSGTVTFTPSTRTGSRQFPRRSP